jgi:hypothetical protein
MADIDKPKNTGKFGKGNTGKPKGALNKTTQAAKDAIDQAAAELGGVARLVEWVKEDASNERVFWGTIYPKLIPLQVNGSGKDGEHLIKCTITLVSANGA